MSAAATSHRFETELLRPADSGGDDSWSFLLVPKSVSEALPRRGRVTVRGSINGCSFQATLDPDGKLGHWLKVDGKLRKSAKARIGDRVCLEISPVVPEPQPALPADFSRQLKASPAARATWERASALAQLDWVHWISSAKQQATRERRIANACDMLASGKLRVCCFDPSGVYSKSLSAPKVAG